MNRNLDQESADDATLIEAVRTRDESAFRVLYRRHSPSMYAFALRMVAGRQDEAHELMQDAWIRALESLGRFRGDSALRTWLIGILVNCYRERYRRERRRSHLELLGAASSVRRDDLAPEDVITLEAAVCTLPDGYREVFLLHDVEGYAHHEIASMLNIHPGTSKSQLSRARKVLRERLSASSAGKGKVVR